MPRIGRNPIYIIGLLLFVIFQFPIIFAPNLATLLVFRFLSGVAASPGPATGAASQINLFPKETATVAVGVWLGWAVLGSTLGPVMGGYAAQEKGWQRSN